MAVLTINQHNDIVQNFVDNVTNSEKSFYMFVGKPTAWPDDSHPPLANSSVSQYEQTIYKDIVFGKRIEAEDVAFMIPRVVWTANTIYDCYDPNDDQLYSRKFFVVTSKNQVYKCIDNNSRSLSTVMPDLNTPSGTFYTSDGYTWKYMYTIDSNKDVKFTSNNYIPVTPDPNVAQSSVGGTVDVIRVTSAGAGYDCYSTGFLSAYVNNYVVQLPLDAAPYDNFYTNNSIYLKGGYGAGQIRSIRSYNGLTRQVVVDTPFDDYVTIELSGINGSQSIGEGVIASQKFTSIDYLYRKGSININDVVVQTSTGATGVVVSANGTTIKVDTTSSNAFVLALPITTPSSSGTQMNGLVSVTSNTNTVTSVSGTQLMVDYSYGDYIRIGDNIRRVMTCNSTVITTDVPFDGDYISNVHFSVPVAIEPSSITLINANGIITDTNLAGTVLSVSNASLVGVDYYVGETVRMVDINGIDQLANGVVAFANSTSVVLESINGTFVANSYLKGMSSLQTTHVDFVKANPTITTKGPNGRFVSGQTMRFSNPTTPDQYVANGTVVSCFYVPNELTEYVISPRVVISGDGTGASAYSTINAVSNSIHSVVMINPGHSYYSANAEIVSNPLYGSGATVTPIVSPSSGHGFNAVHELGCRSVGVSVSFDDIQKESYRFPGYGQYRRIGIIEEPLFSDVVVGVTSFDRAVLTISGMGSNTFANGEYVTQGNAGGIVSNYDPLVNSSVIEIRGIQGTFVANQSGDVIRGISTQSYANVDTFSIKYFTINSDEETIDNITTGSTARLTQVISNNQIRLSYAGGKFNVGDEIVNRSSNTYATIDSIYSSNGTTNVSSSYGRRFNQTARLTFDYNYGNFEVGEVITQRVTGANGVIMSVDDDVDVMIANTTGTFAIGDSVYTSNGYANATVVGSNTTYLKLTCSTGVFSVGDVLNSGSVTATVSNVFNVAVVSDVGGPYPFLSSNNLIVGASSGAGGTIRIANTTLYPDLVRGTGSVVYLDNTLPFVRAETTSEKLSVIIKF